MSRITDISAWILSPISGYVRSGDLGAGVIYSGNLASGQVGHHHFASGALAAGMNALGFAAASRSLIDQRASNSGTILIVSGTGLYCVTAYAEVLQGGLLNVGTLSLRLDWTDDSRTQDFSPITGVALATSGAFSQGTVVVRALSGTPIIMTVSLGSLVGSPRYNAYGAVERIF